MTDQKECIMPIEQKIEVREMTRVELSDFQLLLQIQCGMSYREASSYVAQAFNYDDEIERD